MYAIRSYYGAERLVAKRRAEPDRAGVRRIGVGAERHLYEARPARDLAGAVDRDHVLARDPARGARLAPHLGDELARAWHAPQHLERHLPFEILARRPVDVPVRNNFV